MSSASPPSLHPCPLPAPLPLGMGPRGHGREHYHHYRHIGSRTSLVEDAKVEDKIIIRRIGIE